jgi:hypothetical protein
MKPQPVPFGEWRPDIADLDTQFASEVENVFAGVNSYLPFPSLLPFTLATLPEPACGLYAARLSDTGWKIFAGTAHGLFSWGYAGWTDLTRVSGPYNVAPGDQWVFEQSGAHLVAVNEADNPQWITSVDGASHFDDLPGSPPKAGHVKQIGDFLFLSRLPINYRKIIWSSVNDITAWTISLNLCDEQEFPDNGPVQGICGAEIGYVVQDRGIRTLQFLPGDTNFIFNFSRVLHDRGCISKYGFTAIGNVLYFVSEDGFYAMSGQQVVPIGQDKVNDWFMAHSDIGRRNVVQALAGVNKPYVIWAYHSFEGSQVYDRIIIYNWSNQRWAKATEFAQVWGLLASPGLDLDTDGTEPGDPLLDSNARPLDSFAYIGGRPLIGGIDVNGLLGTLTGPNLPATMETAEVHLVPGMRAFVSEVYPLDDANAVGTVAAGIRERLQDGLPVFIPPAPIEINGSAALFSSSRLHRFRRSIPAGSTWTHAQGVLVDAQQDGTMA